MGKATVLPRLLSFEIVYADGHQCLYQHGREREKVDDILRSLSGFREDTLVGLGFEAGLPEEAIFASDGRMEADMRKRIESAAMPQDSGLGQ